MGQHYSNHGNRRELSPAPSSFPVNSYANLPAITEPREAMAAEYLRIFKRHRWSILLSACAVGFLFLLSGLGTMPLYTTRTSLDIRSVNHDFMDMRSLAPTGDNSPADADINLQTQIKLLQSDTLLDAVKARLLAEPHPNSVAKNDMLSRIARDLHMGGGETLPYSTLVEDTAKRLKVKPLGLTRLVEVSCVSYDPRFAATFCNTLTQTFEDEDQQSRAGESRKTSDWLTKQVADVRERAQDSQKKLEAAMGGDGLMLSLTPTSVGEDRLRSLQDELVKAEADRMQQQANAGVATTADGASLPGVQDNPEHRAYAIKLADLNNELATMLPTLTEQNPKVVKLRSQIADAEAGLRSTQEASTQRQSDEFAAARHREQLLQIAYKAQQSTVSSDLQKAAQVSLLRKELDSEQQLYQTLLQRAKEAGFAAAMQATTIRVVDPAAVPSIPSSPQRAVNGAAGMFLGSLFGVGLAFYRERNDNVFRAPGDVPRFLNVQELGIIPAAAKLKSSSTSAMTLAGVSASSQLGATGDAISLTRWGDNFSIAAEAYRNATFSILLSDASKRARSYIVTSPGAGEGKTTVTSNLGVALSKTRLRVVLIDGDLRRPALHRAYAIDNSFGLRNVLRGEVDLETTPTEILTTRTQLPNISVVPAGEGSEDVVELLHSSYLGALLARLSRDFDIILIDTPPILHMADARILAGHSDGAILVLRAGMTTHDQAADARDIFDHDGVRMVGTILNDFDPTRDGNKGYYGSYYRYQQSAHPTEKVGAGL